MEAFRQTPAIAKPRSVPGDAIRASIDAIRKEAVDNYKAEQERQSATATFRPTPVPQPAPALPRQVAASPALSAPYGGTPPSATTTTMSSREIAELTGKRHDNVKRTIQMLGERGVLGSPQFEKYLDSLGRKAIEYRLGKRDSFVVVAQLSPEFTGRVVDRWQELEESQVAKPPAPVAASNDPLDMLMIQAQMFPRLIAEMQEQRKATEEQRRVSEGQARALEAQGVITLPQFEEMSFKDSLQRPIRPSPESHKPLDSLHFI